MQQQSTNLNKSVNCQEITRKLYADAKKRQEQRESSRSGTRSESKYKPSDRSNQVYAGRILKQIERAFTDLDLLHANCLTLQQFTEVLSFLGYSGEDLCLRDKLLKEAYSYIGGTESRPISRRSLVVFLHALNNVYLPWMSEVASDLPEKEGEYAEFYIRHEQDMAVLHSRYFAFWEYRQKIKTVSVSLKPTSSTL